MTFVFNQLDNLKKPVIFLNHLKIVLIITSPFSHFYKCTCLTNLPRLYMVLKLPLVLSITKF